MKVAQNRTRNYFSITDIKYKILAKSISLKVGFRKPQEFLPHWVSVVIMVVRFVFHMTFLCSAVYQQNLPLSHCIRQD